MTLGIILICFLSKKDNHKKEKESPESSLDRFSTLTSLAKSPVLGSAGVGGAMAVYGAFDALVINAMRSLKDSLRIPGRMGWNGDPCAPTNWDAWEGVTCRPNNVSNSTALDIEWQFTRRTSARAAVFNWRTRWRDRVCYNLLHL
ncbi:hypothetical protein ACFE04_009591 [Oxalis oulophora]